jgi:hypothetical protein
MKYWLFGLLLTATTVSAQGLDVIGRSTPVSGSGRVQVVVGDIGVRSGLVATPPQLQFKVVPSSGSARVTASHYLPAQSEPAVTVLAFDASGSFRPYWQSAFDLGDAFVGGLPSRGNSVDVVTFGTRLDHHGTASEVASDIQASLVHARAIGSDQRATRLKSFVRDAIAAAADLQPASEGGARQVIVFTDGGDESDAYDVDTLVDEARDRGVRVHVVVLHATSRTSPQRLDEVKRLAERTGGRYIQGDDAQQAATEIAALARASQGTWWLDVDFCGVPTGPEYSADTLTVEVLDGATRRAFSDPAPFRQHASGAALEPCSPLPPQPETVAAPPITETPDLTNAWVWTGAACALLSLLGLLGLLGLLALLRRHRAQPEDTLDAGDAAEELVEEAPPVAPPQTAAPGPAVAWRDPFQSIPETHLRLSRGGKGLESFYRVHRSPFVIGGDAAMSPELLLSIPQISGRHCTLQVYKNGSVWVTDEHSTNGTFIDGKRLQPGERSPIVAGQRLGITRHVEFVLTNPNISTPQLDEPPPQAPPEPEPEAKQRPRNRTVYAPVKDKS